MYYVSEYDLKTEQYIGKGECFDSLNTALVYGRFLSMTKYGAPREYIPLTVGYYYPGHGDKKGILVCKIKCGENKDNHCALRCLRYQHMKAEGLVC
jgi:hypothetical protein